MFDDAKNKNLNCRIDISVNKFIELTSAFGISRHIATEIDARIVSTFDIKI